jgi:dihydrofolate reductase
MAAYRPGALGAAEGTETDRRMARRTHDCRKLVFSRSGTRPPTPWHNAELVVAASGAELARSVAALKARPGGDIHLAGGASLAQAVLGLGLVDAPYLFVHPAVSPGAAWFARLPAGATMRLAGATSYENGVVRLHYVPGAPGRAARPATFTDLLAQEAARGPADQRTDA